MSSVREALARDALAQYSDPARRAILLARARAEVHRPLAGVAKEVGLTAEEESRLLDLLAAQSLKVQEDAARCNFDWSLDCSGKRLARDQEEAKQEQRALLGPERFERFENFRDSYAERQQVRELQDRLAGNQRLSDDQGQQLAGMLLEERRKFADEVKQRGEGVGSFATESGQILTVVASAGPDRDAKWLQSGEEFSRRMRERAAVVLTSGQMKAYEQMQEELMSVLRDNARRQAILDTAPQPAETRR
jgi:hypothetical protein